MQVVLVHLSPANGEEDNNIAMKRKVTVFCPIDDEVKFTEDAGKYAGLFVRDADEKLVQSVKDRNALVKIGKIKHKYPLCWRCNHGLVWLARREYFYMLDKHGHKACALYIYTFDQPKQIFVPQRKHPWYFKIGFGDVQFQFGNVMIVKTQNNYSQEKKLLNLQLSYQTEKILN